MSLGAKKRDDKDKENREPEYSGGEASANYIIEGAGEKRDAGGITRSEQFETAARQTVSADKIPPSNSQEYAASATVSKVPQYQEQQQREQRQSVNRALDETRDNIRRSIDEARSQIPNYTQAVNAYQEQSLQTSREIADNYIESQKEIINLLQSSWYGIEAANRILTSNWISPRHFTGIYENMVSNIADNMITTTRLINNMMFASMNVFRFLMPQVRDNTKELSRIGVNIARIFEQTSRETAANTAARVSGRYDDNTATY
ncbi:MAG: hypothetical protein WA364_20595 [Candidatus Nitrosopolaris sp.]